MRKLLSNPFARDEHGVESYGWIHALAVAYMILVGYFAVAAWVADHEPFRAAMCAGAQVLAVVLAILARRSFTGSMPVAGILACAAGFGCAVWAAKGIAHAWNANGEAVEDWQVWFLAGLEPGLFLLAEHVQSKRVAEAKKAAADAKDDAERLRAIREATERREAREHELRMAEAQARAAPADARQEAQESGTAPTNVTRLPGPQKTRVARQVAAGAGTVLAAANGQAVAHAAEPQAVEPVRFGPVAEAPAHAGADARVAKAMALKGQGLTRAETARKMRCSIRTVTRLWTAGAEANAHALALAS